MEYPSLATVKENTTISHILQHVSRGCYGSLPVWSPEYDMNMSSALVLDYSAVDVNPWDQRLALLFLYRGGT